MKHKSRVNYLRLLRVKGICELPLTTYDFIKNSVTKLE
jgi:hypothetical protein